MLLPTRTKVDELGKYKVREPELGLNSHSKYFRKLLNLYPKHCLLYDHIDKFIETAKKRNIKPQEIVEALMQFSQANNPYYIEKSDFEMLLKKSILPSCTNVTKTMFTRNNTEKSFISSKDVELLKRKIDEYVHNSKEGLISLFTVSAEIGVQIQDM